MIDNKKMIQCSTCKVQFAKDAKICPHCGARNKRQSLINSVVWLVAILVLLGFFLSRCGKQNDTEQALAPPSNTQVASESEAQSETEDRPEPDSSQEPEPIPEPDLEPEIIEIMIASNRVAALNSNVTPIEPIAFSRGDFDLRLEGIMFTARNNNSGTTRVVMGIPNLGFDAGFAIGFNYARTDLGNRDALLALFVSITPNEAITSPRDVPEIPRIVAPGILDDREVSAVFIANTVEDAIATVGQLAYGIILYGVYSDSEYFYLTIDGVIHRLAASSLTYITD